MPSPERTCKSCEVRISNREAIYNCVGCHESMHLKLACVGISEAIYGLMQISRKVLIFCKDCVRKNQRDIFLNTIASHQNKSVAHRIFSKPCTKPDHSQKKCTSERTTNTNPNEFAQKTTLKVGFSIGSAAMYSMRTDKYQLTISTERQA